MDPSTISASSFTLAQGATSVTGSVTYVGTTATFAPSTGLIPGAAYTATITTQAKDLAGNALAGNYVWNFTAGSSANTTPPTVISTAPATSALGVSAESSITATFSEAMAPLTVTTATFTLQNAATPVPGTVTYLGTTATFAPLSIWVLGC